MRNIFEVVVNQQLHLHTDQAHTQVSELLRIFPHSHFLKTQRALLCYNARDFEEAEVQFDEIIREDPNRLDDMDTYSNILYVMEKRQKLAFLAQLATETDKYRPETCCIVGNYYSLKSEHEKAVIYFRRALTLDRNCLTAWTLMGHEYVEMKNTHAAIEAYRRAVEANRKDYRAWYGLGQTYEVLEMHYYALYYYQRAAAIRPYDQRMWQALGNCFENLDRPDEAMKAYKRAIQGSAMDPAVLLRVGGLYEKAGDVANAVTYFRQCLKEEEGEGPSDESVRSRLWLARYEYSKSNWITAREHCDELTQSGNSNEEVKALLKDLRLQLGS